MGGGFGLVIMRMYIWGKISALHNTHQDKPRRFLERHNALIGYKSVIFRYQVVIYMGAIFEALCNTHKAFPNDFSL